MMAVEQSLSERLIAIYHSANVTSAESNMAAEVRIGRNGLVIQVVARDLGPAIENQQEAVIPWGRVDSTDALDVAVSGEVLTLVEKIKRDASKGKVRL